MRCCGAAAVPVTGVVCGVRGVRRATVCGVRGVQLAVVCGGCGVWQESVCGEPWCAPGVVCGAVWCAVVPCVSQCGVSWQGLPGQKPWRRKCFEKHELQALTEYAAGSFSRTQISKLIPNNQCYNSKIVTQVKGHVDGWHGLYLKVTQAGATAWQVNSTF